MSEQAPPQARSHAAGCSDRQPAPSGISTRPRRIDDLDLAPGKVLLQRWRIVRDLGKGGFGAVFEVVDTQHSTICAVKVLHPSLANQGEALARFRREGAVMQRLQHPRIVRVHHYQEDLAAGLALIIMDYVPGCAVRELVTRATARRAMIPVQLVLRILEQTLDALAAAHANRVIHRDITPGNILLAGGSAEELLEAPDRDPKVRLVDFGIAGLAQRGGMAYISHTAGTAPYMAPEVLDPRGRVTPAADVYSAGAVAYQLLTGLLPVGSFPPPSTERAELGTAVDNLLLSLLQNRSTLRPSSATARRRSTTILGQLPLSHRSPRLGRPATTAGEQQLIRIGHRHGQVKNPPRYRSGCKQKRRHGPLAVHGGESDSGRHTSGVSAGLASILAAIGVLIGLWLPVAHRSELEPLLLRYRAGNRPPASSAASLTPAAAVTIPAARNLAVLPGSGDTSTMSRLGSLSPHAACLPSAGSSGSLPTTGDTGSRTAPERPGQRQGSSATSSRARLRLPRPAAAPALAPPVTTRIGLPALAGETHDTLRSRCLRRATVTRDRTVSGVVLDEAGNRLPRVLVQLLDASGRQRCTASTGTDGWFRIGQVADTDTLRFDLPGRIPYQIGNLGAGYHLEVALLPETVLADAAVPPLR